jgi:hypothetical protein
MILLVNLRCRMIRLPVWLAFTCQQGWTPCPWSGPCANRKVMKAVMKVNDCVK